MVFGDLEKTFDCVPREVLAIMKMHKNITTSVRTDGERSEEFQVKVESTSGLSFQPSFLCDGD